MIEVDEDIEEVFLHFHRTVDSLRKLISQGVEKTVSFGVYDKPIHIEK